MLAVVKKPHTKQPLFEIKGEIPQSIIDYFTHKYGNKFEVIEEQDQLIDITETDWFKNINILTSSGETIKIYRQNIGLTQTELGKKLGNFTRHNISDMENGRRGISKNIAKKLSLIFDVPVERFL